MGRLDESMDELMDESMDQWVKLDEISQVLQLQLTLTRAIGDSCGAVGSILQALPQITCGLQYPFPIWIHLNWIQSHNRAVGWCSDNVLMIQIFQNNHE